MFPPKKDDGGKAAGKPGQQGSGLHEALQRPMRPSGPRPGQGMDPHEAMMGGMGDMSQFAPPAPSAPMGPDGLPIGGGMPTEDPAFDPSMDGSSLFQALNSRLDPAMGQQGGMPGQQPQLEQLLAMLALQQAGVGGGPQSPSGMMADPTNPGGMMGVANPDLIQ